MDLISILFIQFTIVIAIFGSLMNLVEKYLPNNIRRLFRYGKHQIKEESRQDELIKSIEIPKSYFKHFYIFAIIWAWLGLLLAISVYFFDYQPHIAILKYLNLSCGTERKAETSSLKTLVTLVLITMQCTRRFIETNFLQIFSKKSKINLTQYMCGYLHYYGLVVLVLAKAEGFQMNQDTKPLIEIPDIILATPCCVIFIYFWYKQFESNMIFINLRKTKSGKVSTESHLLPKGGLFKYVSSPHMTCEIAMYLILYALLYQNTTYIYCLTWVISNQLCNAILTHKWYLDTFKDYPERKAIIPFIL